MKNLTSYLFVMFMVMFWVFRIIVAFCYNLGIEFMVIPMDFNFEIVLLFLTFLAILLVIKRSILGALIYLVGYGLYFGMDIFNAISNIGQGMNLTSYTNLVISFIGVILPLMVLFDMLLDKNRKDHPVDKKTDWFFKNKDFDRQYDERADRNQYKL